MKGTIKDLRLASDLAEKHRYADAIKVLDRMLGLVAGADAETRLAALKAAVMSDEPLFDIDPAEVTARPEAGPGIEGFSVNLTRMKVPADMVGELLVLRTRWHVARLDAERSQDALVASIEAAMELVHLIQEPEAAQIARDEQASMLALAADPFFIVLDYEMVWRLLGGAFHRAPANKILHTVTQSLVTRLRENILKDNPSALANREKYREGLAKLEPLLLATTAARRDG